MALSDDEQSDSAESSLSEFDEDEIGKALLMDLPADIDDLQSLNRLSNKELQELVYSDWRQFYISNNFNENIFYKTI